MDRTTDSLFGGPADSEDGLCERGYPEIGVECGTNCVCCARCARMDMARNSGWVRAPRTMPSGRYAVACMARGS